MNSIIRNISFNLKPYFDVPEGESKWTRFLALLTALTALVPICGFLGISVELIFYGLLTIDFIFLLSKGPIKLNGIFLFFYVVLIANVLIIDIPPFFRPFERLILFIFVSLIASSALESRKALIFRRYLFKYIVIGIVLLSVGSFFCYFLGINFMKRYELNLYDFEVYSNHGGWFSGLTTHSMILGPISMIATILLYSLFIGTNRKLYLILFICSLGSALFSASRSAVLGVTIAILYSLIFGRYSQKIRYRIIWLFILCGFLSLPFSDFALKGIRDKNESRIERYGTVNNRQDKWDYRLSEFESSPLLGVGFGAIDINGGDVYDPGTGHVEPGSSHLSVLSMTGLLGFVAYLIIIYQAFVNAYRNKSAHSKFVLLCFIALFVHGWFEGYVLSAGGFLAFLYWLVVGQCIDCKKTVA